ncbi:hypothetical protein GX51_02628 [Blastomyces parvus]|uniref:Zn(2)-C6 fungal-type domain-containing protein n=1 Tax=Blastomyces parvus TaxID=2060905 RepID=A0A2B7XBF7_9EURO|nr:hypothetical protein GX51_02628 [Blastomyces parvus]
MNSHGERSTVGGSQDDGDRSWSRESSSLQEPLRSKTRFRRSHQKSRTGCLICKRRRVKCDETKPRCHRCQRHGVNCQYHPAEPLAAGRNRALEILGDYAAPTGEIFSLALSSTARSISELLQEANEPFPPAGGANIPGSSNAGRRQIDALHHFALFTSHTMGAPIARHIIRSQVLPLALSSPHLMHVLIAISRAHLSRLVPSYQGGRSEESYHWQRAVALFQREMMLPINQHNMNAVISTCIMLAVLAFTCDDTTATGSWVFSESSTANNWLYVQGGLPTILARYREQANDNIWVPVIHDSDDHHGTYSDKRPGPDGLPPEFVELCEIYPDSDGENNPYHPPLRAIASLQKLEPSSLTFTKLVTFVGTVKSGYRLLLQRKDPRALLILGYWFAMMCSVDQWWVQARVKSECAAICRFLEQNPDQRIQQLLSVPAVACGYTLNHHEVAVRV